MDIMTAYGTACNGMGKDGTSGLYVQYSANCYNTWQVTEISLIHMLKSILVSMPLFWSLTR